MWLLEISPMILLCVLGLAIWSGEFDRLCDWLEKRWPMHR